MIGYCVKCRAKRDMKDTEQVTTKNGKQATRGLCATCGTVIYKLGAEPGV